MTPFATPADTIPTPADTSRGSVVAVLAVELGRLSAAGDHEGALVLTETIAKLLGGQKQEPGVVVSLEERRHRR